MRLMGIATIYPKPKTTQRHPCHPLPSDSTSRWTPLLRLAVPPRRGPQRTCTSWINAMPGAQKKAPADARGFYSREAWRCPTLTWGDPTLPSALSVFTSEFGMESGGSRSLLPPGKPFDDLHPKDAGHRIGNNSNFFRRVSQTTCRTPKCFGVIWPSLTSN